MASLPLVRSNNDGSYNISFSATVATTYTLTYASLCIFVSQHRVPCRLLVNGQDCGGTPFQLFVQPRTEIVPQQCTVSTSSSLGAGVLNGQR